MGNYLKTNRFASLSLRRTKRILLIVYLCFVNSIFVYAQNAEDVLDYASERVILNPEETIRIGERYLQRSNLSTKKTCEAHLVLSRAHFLLEKYDKSIDSFLKISYEGCDFEQENLFLLLTLQINNFHSIGLTEHRVEVEKQIKQLIASTDDDQLSEKRRAEWLVNKNYLLFIDSLRNGKTPNTSSVDTIVLLNEDIELLAKNHMLKTISTQDKDEYLDFKTRLQSKLSINDSDLDKIYFRYFALNEAKVLVQEGKLESATKLLQEILESLGGVNGLSFSKKNIYELLVDINIQNRAKDSVIKYRDLENKYVSETDAIFSEAINKVFSHETKLNFQKQKIQKGQLASTRNLILVIAVVILLFLLVYLLRFSWQKKHYKEISAFLNKMNKSSPVQEKLDKKEKPEVAQSKISQSVEDEILNGLKHFEERNGFLEKDISLGYVASELKVNTKYLSKVINSNLNESFSGYINRLRIEFIVSKLQNEPKYLKYKISYLAEVTGYTSHSSFSTAFKSVTGVPPTTFINYLKRSA